MWNCCGNSTGPSLMYPMQFDLYTAITNQNEYGELRRRWHLVGKYYGKVDDVTENRLDPGTISKYDPYCDLYCVNNFIQPGVVMQELMITNLRDSNGNILFPEPYSELDSGSLFEIRGVLGGMDVTGIVSYYIYKLVRSHSQDVVLI